MKSKGIVIYFPAGYMRSPDRSGLSQLVQVSDIYSPFFNLFL